MSQTNMRAAALFLTLVASSLPAQISWGPALGLNLSKFGGSDATAPGAEQSNKMGLVAGVVVDKATEGKPLFWRSGLLYSMEGSTSKDASTGAEATIKLNYIRIPVIVGWKLGAAGAKTVPYVAGGASLGLKAGCDFDLTSGGTSASFACDDPIFSGGLKVKGFDIGLAVGGGVAMAAGSGTIDFSALYRMGLTSIDGSAAADDVKNQGFTVLVVYKLPMKKK